MKYYHIHALVALTAQIVFTFILYALQAPLIAASYGGGAVGATIYISREIRDREKLGYWDHKGWIWPLATVVTVWITVLVSTFLVNVYMK